jgi:hypothetical protein
VRLRDLERQNRRATNEAGPRYSPGLDPKAPNIQISHLVDALDALSLADGYRARLQDLAARLEKARESARNTTRPIFNGLKVTPEVIQADLERVYGSTTLEGAIQSVRPLRQHARRVSRKLEAVVKDLHEKRASLGEERKRSEERNRLDAQVAVLYQLQSALDDILSYLEGPTGDLLVRNNCLLLLGSWGTGKTHFLCDIARQRSAQKRPCVLVLSGSLPTSTDPLEAVALRTKLAATGDDVLVGLERLGIQSKGRALLLIDAINEGDRQAWRRHLRSLVRRLGQYPHVGLVLSCRRPFEKSILTPATEALFIQLEHPGFEEKEFDAQLDFFAYYGIPAPRVPLITPEFSRPLFIKLFCDALRRLSHASQKRKMREIASGQRGMTYVMEHFVREVGAPIEKDFGLAPKACWALLKGIPSRVGSGFAAAMSDSGKDWVTTDEASALIRAVLTLNPGRANQLLHRLISDGLLAEEMRWESDAWVEAIRFPYQRFSDHLIARHLLEAHLVQGSEQAIRRCFYANRKLGAIFQLDQWGREFRSPGVATALMIEFPERVKRAGVRRELIHYLPRRRKLVSAVKDVFLDGLYWRSRDAFGEDTDRLVSFFLEGTNAWTQRETLEVLVGLASRPGHPYSAIRLQRYLAMLTMPERDVQWSEFLRHSGRQSSIYRVLAWIEKAAGAAENEDSAANELRLLSLQLTTTDRRLRDRVTHAIFLVGLRHPQSLFNEVLASLSFNDPYVPERMLAAAYGVVMRSWRDSSARAFRKALVPFARALVRDMFLPNAPHATRHTLMRGYALGITQLARKVQPGAIATQQVRFLRPPFNEIPSPFRSAAAIKEAEVKDARQAMQMDFENYTVGRLVPDRGNYQEDHSEYQAVRRQVAGRMIDLGYSASVFDTLDTDIGQAHWRDREEGKTDRYGKKYSWIAFFEMYGLRADKGKLDEKRNAERSSDCDIDPSFPEPAKTWRPPLPELFRNAPRKASRWLREGPVPDYQHLLVRNTVDDVSGSQWVLLDGFVQQSGSYERETTTILRTLLVDRQRVGAIRKEVETNSQGGYRIPDPYEDYYALAGEVPWSPMFGSAVRRAHGTAGRHRERAFDRWAAGMRAPGVMVEVPVHRWIWESHHSTFNQVSGIMFPSPALCEALGLAMLRSSFDLVDQEGRRSTIYREFNVADRYFSSHLLYIRADLMRRYLHGTNQLLVWIPSGERSLHWKQFQHSFPPDIQAAFTEEANDFGSLVLWEG